MDIHNEETDTKGSFFIKQDGKRVAEMIYSKAGTGRIIIEHTEVSEVLRGKNAGKQLVAAAVDHARKKNLRIIPLCPFTLSVFKRVKEYEDVWDK